MDGLYLEDRGAMPHTSLSVITDSRIDASERIVRGIYGWDRNAFVGFFMNGVPAYIERAKDSRDAKQGSSVLSITVRHTYNGVFPQRDPRAEPLEPEYLIDALASHLKLDPDSLGGLLDGHDSERQVGWNESVHRAMFRILKRHTPFHHDLEGLARAGWGYVEFNAPVLSEKSA